MMVVAIVLVAVALISPFDVLAMQFSGPSKDLSQEYRDSSSIPSELLDLAGLDSELNSSPSDDYEHRHAHPSGIPDLNRTPPHSPAIEHSQSHDSNPLSPITDDLMTAEERLRTAIALYMEQLDDDLNEDNRYVITMRLCELILEFLPMSEIHDSTLESLIRWEATMSQVAAASASKFRTSNAPQPGPKSRPVSGHMRFDRDNMPLIADFYLHRFPNSHVAVIREYHNRRSISSMIICYVCHCGASTARFSARHPLLPISSFRKNYCNRLDFCNYAALERHRDNHRRTSKPGRLCRAALQHDMQVEVRKICSAILARTDLPEAPDHDHMLGRILASEANQRRRRGQDPFPVGGARLLPLGKTRLRPADIRLVATLYKLFFVNLSDYTTKLSKRFTASRLGFQRALLCFARNHGGDLLSFSQHHSSISHVHFRCQCAARPRRQAPTERPLLDLVKESAFLTMTRKTRSLTRQARRLCSDLHGIGASNLSSSSKMRVDRFASERVPDSAS